MRRAGISDLPDRNGVFGYLTDVLERQVDRLGGGIERPARYFYELAIRHEDMHVEALAYTRQTLAYARPQGLGDAGRARRRRVARRRRRAGRDAGGSARPPADGFVFDNEKWAHEVDVAPFRIAKAPVTNAEFAAFVDGRRLSPPGILERGRLGLARARGRRAAGLLAAERRRRLDLAALPRGRAAGRRMRR